MQFTVDKRFVSTAKLYSYNELYYNQASFAYILSRLFESRISFNLLDFQDREESLVISFPTNVSRKIT